MADREKVTKGLEVCLAADLSESENPCAPCPYFFDGMCQNTIKKDALDLLREQKTNGWISVKDRLPETETEVIIIVQHKIGWYRAFAWHDEYGWHSSAEEFGDGESDFVTYWMPLPEPPEEVSGE